MGHQLVNGAYGSVWNTVIAVHNDADEVVTISPIPGALCIDSCGSIVGKATISPFLILSPDPGGGGFVYVGHPGANGKVNFSLRIQDVSRQAQTWGTSIPVIHERDTFSGRVILLDVPTDPRFRSTLRIYDYDVPADRQIRLRAFELSSKVPLVDIVLVLTPAHNTDGDPVDPNVYPPYPGHATVGDLVTAFPQLVAAKELRLELEPVTPGLRFWAFVSVTNNETQHVTTIVP
jgi:hypothetical protein